MKITGTLINYFFHCKRQCYLFYNRINLEDNSEDVNIGRVLHEIKFEDDIKFENIALDKITDEYVIEFKKSDSDETASMWQLLFYLKKLKEIGILRKGLLEFGENKKLPTKRLKVELTDDKELELEQIYSQISELMSLKTPPDPLKSSLKCKKCAYFSYCFI
ncbi:CRISPR-associated protein Cas4 [Campylobacter fetus]|uniref:Crispr-associated protein Cas4 n=2 Tax=Campylobacter fetus TaxID=196 RepID=A0RNQ6_CAMFF|nr:CRISPR-associated protein Cas4 [Campylobacter fetus]ABK82202.1 crispr-associated protein Cas4 [Campylobacter fetus subsp. fetus 82-40]EAI3887391.1 Dna2/Cas4 domain-containing protein [Campylobacter fetus]EAI3916585.1 Dna2/Cas4 domain-containing protein [Campylobacter fetus]EAI3920010.1 Dna2/Cas4 domain-containing protein [Campylobacter fetus]EAI8859960.1 Dna2/Cas4 domain-containing protein [Campylobacter fetus]